VGGDGLTHNSIIAAKGLRGASRIARPVVRSA
jgi:hypothetical protein